MDILFEQRIAHNAAFGAEAIWISTFAAYEASARTSGITFPLVYLVLPLVLHRRTALALATKTQPGALFKAISEDREIPVGLQSRVESMARRTSDALALAFRSKLVALDTNEEKHLIPVRKTNPFTHHDQDSKIVLSAAKRIGQTFAELPAGQICTTLGIRL
jgi:hypothetical protein